MSGLFEVRGQDRAFYERYLRDFLPERMIDVHTHVWLEAFRLGERMAGRSVTWPSLVAEENPIEDLLETYRLMFPGKKVDPVIFGSPSVDMDLERSNAYIAQCAARHGLHRLLLTTPVWDGEAFRNKLREGGFKGAKVYLEFAPAYIPKNEIRIFDFAPHHQLSVLDELGLVLMLHIPRNLRLRDPVNLAELLEIEKRYPNIRLIVAHVGRAYCTDDVGDAFEVLGDTRYMMFDISANANQGVFKRALAAVGPGRLLFGSDMPILRMRCRRTEENGRYVNIVPPGLYGDISQDANMREAQPAEAEEITFFMYEEINAFRLACGSLGIGADGVRQVFYHNAETLFADTGTRR